MNKITDLNAYRRKRYVRLATESGWDTHVGSDEPMANAWIYSVRLDGSVRAAGQLLQRAMEKMGSEMCSPPRQHDVDVAGCAIQLLDKDPDDHYTQNVALAVLADYFSRTKTWQCVPAASRRSGVHMIVVDWKQPDSDNVIVLRPAIAVSIRMLSEELLQVPVASVLAMERARHPERLPEAFR